jgi:hypothetical protein
MGVTSQCFLAVRELQSESPRHKLARDIVARPASAQERKKSSFDEGDRAPSVSHVGACQCDSELIMATDLVLLDLRNAQ